RNHYRRLVVADGVLAPLPDPPPRRGWTFDAPFGEQPMVAMPFSEVITLSRHLPARRIEAYLNLRALQDVRDPATPPPVASDDSGRSAQRFAMAVEVRRGDEVRGAAAGGRDIYAVSAPLVVEAAERVLGG